MSLVVNAINVPDDATRDRVWNAFAYQFGWVGFDALTLAEKQAKVDLQVSVYLEEITVNVENMILDAANATATTIVFS